VISEVRKRRANFSDFDDVRPNAETVFDLGLLDDHVD